MQTENPRSQGFRPLDRTGSQQGFTLLEVLIYTAVLAVLALPLATVVLVSIRSTVDHDTMNAVSERNRTVLGRLSTDLRPALFSTVSIGSSGTVLTFNLPGGFNSTGTLPGDQIRYTFDNVPSDPANGADDNGNGLVDEGRLVRENLDAGTRVTITHGIDLANSQFQLAGDTVVTTLRIMGELGTPGNTWNVDRTLTVAPRN